MQEPVRITLAVDEARVDGFPEGRVHRLRCFPMNQDQCGDLDDVAQAGEVSQGFLGGGREPLQLPGHEFHHVVGVVPGADAIDVPLPGQRDRVERQQTLFGQRREELDREERIAAGLLLHELRQGPRLLRLAMQGIGDEPAHIVEPERRQHDLLDTRAGRADRLQRPQQRVRGTDLVVAVGPDQQQVPHLRVRDHVLEEVERRRIQPLQVVEEQRQRVLRPREDAEEAPENHLEPVLRVLRRHVRDRRLCSDHQLQLGDEVDDELTVRAQRLAQGGPPPAELRLAPAQQRADQAPEGLGQRGIRDVALVLVELAGGEQAARRDEHLVQLVDHRGLADPGIAGDEHQLRRAIGHDPVEGREQRVDLALAAVERLGDQQPVRHVLRAQRERVDAAVCLPFRPAATEVGRDARGGLVAILGGLGQKPHHDRRERPWDAVGPLARRRRLPGDVAMDPLHRIGGDEGRRPRQHLVEGDAQRVEVAAGIDRAVHAAGLLRRHVGERPGDHLGRLGGLALARQPRGDAEADQPYGAGRGVDQDVGRLDVLVDEAPLVEPAQRVRQADGDAQERRDLPGPPQEPRQRLAAGVLEHERQLPAVTPQPQGPGREGGVQLVPQRMGVLQPRQARRRGPGRRGGHHQDRGRLALAHAPGQDELLVLPQRLE